MDPFSALGLACGIVQFVDFSCKLFSQTKKIYGSSTGSSDQLDSIADISNNLLKLSSKLVTPAAARAARSKHAAVDPLTDLAMGCEEAATDILAAIEGLRARNPSSKWSSFRSALAVVWRQERIQGMKSRLEDYRRQIVVTLEVMQHEQQSSILQNIDALYQANVRMESTMAGQVAELRKSVVGALERIRAEFNQQNEGYGFETDFFSGVDHPNYPDDVNTLTSLMTEDVKEIRHIRNASKLLESLRFRSMSFRHSKISDSHHNTFRWMFSQNFANWLSSDDDQVFWISGKPGSGKSTMMKFLCDNTLTYEKLRLWSGDGQLVTAKYFFWINGTEVQKSQEGLLQALLFDILRQSPKLFKVTFPAQWDEYTSKVSHEDGIWARQDLLDALTRLFRCKTTSVKFCIFIDGLDEYSGDHEDLIALIRDMASTRNVKLCVASRPWNVFETGFGQNKMLKLYLEQFNKRDIKIYVHDKLEDRDDFRALAQREPKAIELTEEIVERAKGVFLWVFLVVRSLTRGLQNSDPLSDLQRRLKSFPSDLDEFFSHILMSLEDFYRYQAARNFQVALAAPRPLSLLNYWYLDVEESEPDYLDKIPTEPMSWDLDTTELDYRQEQMWKRINGRSKGLLEVTYNHNVDAPFNSNVDFLHRTVKDFLLTKNTQSMLLEWSQSRSAPLSEFNPEPTLMSYDFNPYQSICRSSFAELKSAPTTKTYEILSNSEHVRDRIEAIFVSARRDEEKTGEAQGALLESLERVIPGRFKMKIWHPVAPSFEEYATMWNLKRFVQETLEISRKRGLQKSLLNAAFKGQFDSAGNLSLAPDPEMIEVILETPRFFEARLTMSSWEMVQLASWLEKFKAHNIQASLLQLFTSSCVTINADDKFWVAVKPLLTDEQLSTLKRLHHVKQTPWNKSAKYNWHADGQSEGHFIKTRPQRRRSALLAPRIRKRDMLLIASTSVLIWLLLTQWITYSSVVCFIEKVRDVGAGEAVVSLGELLIAAPNTIMGFLAAGFIIWHLWTD